ncbi:MAG: hypothetical protein K6E99_03545 [Bacilli bacterium]|nr:hypothetical protein [Bacilli bacterium]
MNDNKNPYAHQKITSKKLFIEPNYVKPTEEEDNGGVKAIGLLLTIGLIVVCIAIYLYYIYPTFIKGTYTVEEACNNPYECTELEDGSRRCSYYDSQDKMVIVDCPALATTSSSSTQVKTTSND